MVDTPAPDEQHFRIRRDASGALAWFRDNWREKRRFRIGGYIIGGLIALYALMWLTVMRNLPSAEGLLQYQPPLPSMVRGIDGEIVYSYARERRVQLRFVDFPKPLINAYLSAEDKTFWTHGGVDYTGLAGAVVDYATKIGSGRRSKGGSTITQQVAKNILLTNEYSLTRKLKEMILARRIEGVLNKQQILELYLNEIPLGRQSFGVQAASRAYFGKDVGDLQLQEAAFLAVLPKSPETYGRAKYANQAIERRNWVLDQMVKNDWATAEQASFAKAQPLGLIPRQAESYDPSVGYYVEEVRRRLIARYGEKAENGPYSVYAGGLWIRTSLDQQLQKATQDALRAGLIRYHGGRAWAGPIDKIDLSDGKWQTELLSLNRSIHYQNWRIGAVIQRSDGSASIGFADGSTAGLTGMADSLRAGDVIAAAPVGNRLYAVRTIPEVSGGMLVENPQSGRILAMQGGFDSGLGAFNRATQAMRQPGSTIKPFVYATGLDFGMTPSTMVLDGTFCVYQGARFGKKCFVNFGGGGGSGNHAGMDNVVKTINRVGIGKYSPYLSYALGAGDTTVLQMVNGYAALANNGVQHDASMVDFVQDRQGKVIWRADNRRCTGCNMAKWDGKPMPRLAMTGKQVMDPRTAYQTVHMLEGVVTRGTAVTLRDLGLPLFGKTGTTSGPTNVWFVGGSSDIVGGVYLGYDQPRSLGGYAQGGSIAAPIFKQFVQATRSHWSDKPFTAPAGVRMVRVDRISGKRVFGGDPGDDPKSSLIWEAFKEDTEAIRSTRADDIAAQRDALLSQLRRGSQAVKQRQADSPSAQPTIEAQDVVGDVVSGTQPDGQ